jgi:ATP-dependent Lon protease
MVRQLPAGSIASLSSTHRASVARWRLVSSSSSSVYPSRSLASYATPSRSLLASTSALPSASTFNSRHSRAFASSAAVDATSLFHPSLPRLYPRKHDLLKRQEEEEQEREENETEETERKDIGKRPTETPAEAEGRSSSTSSTSGSAGASSASDGGESSTPPSSDNGDDAPNHAISKRSVPEVYPQVLALPITRRPLFPGFYKAVVVRNPAVIAAIEDAMKRGQPYIGAFLLKDENADSDM